MPPAPVIPNEKTRKPLTRRETSLRKRQTSRKKPTSNAKNAAETSSYVTARTAGSMPAQISRNADIQRQFLSLSGLNARSAAGKSSRLTARRKIFITAAKIIPNVIFQAGICRRRKSVRNAEKCSLKRRARGFIAPTKAADMPATATESKNKKQRRSKTVAFLL